MKYRKKELFDVFQYKGYIRDCNGNYCVPDWIVEAINKRIIRREGNFLWLRTNNDIDDDHMVSCGDYIIKDQEGDFYSCKKEWFTVLYELAEEK